MAATARSASSRGGHPPPSMSMVAPFGANTIRPAPANPMKPAGTAAHRCGCSVHRIESVASNAQLAANVSRTVPVIKHSCAPASGPTPTSGSARRAPAARHPATIGPMRCVVMLLVPNLALEGIRELDEELTVDLL